MTIFPCSRCGGVPEIQPGTPGQNGRAVSVVLRHVCQNGRTYKVEFCGPYLDECRNDCIYRWNESNAKDNPAWWPERYDYLHTSCKTGRR